MNKNPLFNIALARYLSSLPYMVRVAKSRDIRETLGISVFVLSDWRRGRTALNAVFFDKISEIVGEDLRSYIQE